LTHELHFFEIVRSHFVHNKTMVKGANRYHNSKSTTCYPAMFCVASYNNSQKFYYFCKSTPFLVKCLSFWSNFLILLEGGFIITLKPRYVLQFWNCKNNICILYLKFRTKAALFLNADISFSLCQT